MRNRGSENRLSLVVSAAFVRLPLLICGLLVAMGLLLWSYTPAHTAPRGRRLYGTVFEAGTLKPIAGAYVVLSASQASFLTRPKPLRVETDADGVYELSPLPDGEFDVTVATDQFSPFRVVEHFVTTGGPRDTLLDAVVPKRLGASVRGRVVSSATGLPVPNVELDDGLHPPVVTDADGDVTLRGLASNSDVALTVTRSGFPTIRTQVRTFTADRIANVMDSLPDDSALVPGTLVDASGKPLADTEITFEQSTGFATGDITVATTDARGVFSVQLTGGSWNTWVQRRFDGVSFTVDSSLATQPVVALTVREVPSHFCRILRADGRPARQAFIQTFSADGKPIVSRKVMLDRSGAPSPSLSDLLALPLFGSVSTAPYVPQAKKRPPPPKLEEALMRAYSDGAVGEVELPRPRGPCELRLGAPSELIIKAPPKTVSWAELSDEPDGDRRVFYFSESVRLPVSPGPHTVKIATTNGGEQTFAYVAGQTPVVIVAPR